MRHPHIEALHSVRGIHYDEELGVRTNKENVLEGYGFHKGTNTAEFKVFDYANPDEVDMRSYLCEKVGEGKYTALLFKDGKWESMGGCPVVYVMCEEDINEKLYYDEAGRIAQTVGGSSGSFMPDKATKLNMYTRTRSIRKKLGGFDNYSDPLEVALGGGFRLQVDELVIDSSQHYLIFSAYFSFNDYGSRILAMATEDDQRIPVVHKSIMVPIIDGKLDLPISKIENRDPESAGDAVDSVLSVLFANDGEAINNMTRDLLTIRPVMQVHQYEGIYGISAENGISVEVIDFDGLDIYDLKPDSTEPTPFERLIGSQLVRAGYLVDIDSNVRVIYHQQQNKIRDSLAQLSTFEEINDNVRAVAVSQEYEDTASYFKRLNMYGRLARSIGYYGLEWLQTTLPHVSMAKFGDWTITKIEAGMFETAFVEYDGRFIPINNGREMYDLIRRVFGGDILRLHTTLSKEGD